MYGLFQRVENAANCHARTWARSLGVEKSAFFVIDEETGNALHLEQCGKGFVAEKLVAGEVVAFYGGFPSDWCCWWYGSGNDFTNVNGFATSPLTITWNFVELFSSISFPKVGICAYSASVTTSVNRKNIFPRTKLIPGVAFIRLTGFSKANGPIDSET